MKAQTIIKALKSKLNLFYILAFAPLPPLMYYRYTYFNDPIGFIIPLYGFFIIAMKRDSLSDLMLTNSHLQSILGTLIVISSFFAYYIIEPFVPVVGFYGLANYTIHLLGLVVAFFRIPALKQAFSAFFLIIASAFTGLAFRWIEYQMEPTVPYYVSLFSSVLNLFGVSNYVPNPTTIYLFTPRGGLNVRFGAGCIGVYSIIIFSIFIVVTMVETPVNKKTKLLWSLAGLIGVFLLNIVRLLIVVASMYFYGYEFGQRVHQYIGYVLFLSWLAVFLILFTKRQTIIDKVQIVQRKILGTSLEQSDCTQVRASHS